MAAPDTLSETLLQKGLGCRTFLVFHKAPRTLTPLPRPARCAPSSPPTP
eukprot:CAMPEP_0172889510 /NCGR_PEP_ID=MMETSP1075-20121228/139047_1 /TAXON_ID=2916 /ORGANISM="Ceratium fusus, Strain PA161109" /LENGTH=48 /DNA_ID= /DNA_START= /DNA_END= /DNA_ORIENTATION=